MTESEWLASTDAYSMVEFVRNATTTFRRRWQGPIEVKRFPVSERKWHLLGCAVAGGRYVLPEWGKAFLVLIEDWIDGKATLAQVAAGLPTRIAGSTFQSMQPGIDQLGATWQSASMIDVLHSLECDQQLDETADSLRQVALVRCILGNPFRPTKLDRVLLSAYPIVEQIARSIYEDRAFRELSILADSLEDAGCDEADLLAHLRSPGPHARGCWPLDLVLGKE